MPTNYIIGTYVHGKFWNQTRFIPGHVLMVATPGALIYKLIRLILLAGIEPARHNGQGILSPQRLPVPP